MSPTIILFGVLAAGGLLCEALLIILKLPLFLLDFLMILARPE